MHSATGTQTKEAMKCAGFKQVDIKYYTYQNRIDRLKKKIVASSSSQIVVRDSSIVALYLSHIVVRYGSTSSPSILTVCSGKTAIVGAPPSQVIILVTPRTAMTEALYVDIDTTSTLPRDAIRRKTSRRLQQRRRK